MRERMVTPNDCARCGEDAIVISSGIKAMTRVRRFSHCKNYHSDRNGGTPICRTSICDSPESAVAEWNNTHGRSGECEKAKGE